MASVQSVTHMSDLQLWSASVKNAISDPQAASASFAVDRVYRTLTTVPNAQGSKKIAMAVQKWSISVRVAPILPIYAKRGINSNSFKEASSSSPPYLYLYRTQQFHLSWQLDPNLALSSSQPNRLDTNVHASAQEWVSHVAF